MASFDAADLSVLLATFQAALAAKSVCIDSLQAGLAQHRQELALAWAATEKERQARTVAEDGVQALQGALDKSREQLRQEMGTRRADHHKLLAQLSCEWQVLEVLEEEQARREAAEVALQMTQRWMQKTLLRCQQLQNQHHLQQQQIKAAQSERDAWWASWVQRAAVEQQMAAQLCAQAEVNVPDFVGLLTTAPKEAPAKEACSRSGARLAPCTKGCLCLVHSAAKGEDAAAQAASLPGSPGPGVSGQAGGFGSDCERGSARRSQPQCSAAGSRLSKSVSWSQLDTRAAPVPSAEEHPAGAAQEHAQQGTALSSRPASSPASAGQQEAHSSGGSFAFTPTPQRQGGDTASQALERSFSKSASKTFQPPAELERWARSPTPDSKAARGPNKTPLPSGAPGNPQDFGGLVTRIVVGSVTPSEPKACEAGAVRGARRVEPSLRVAGSKSAPTSPLRRACAAVFGPSQGLKDLTTTTVFRSSRKGSHVEAGPVWARRFKGQPSDAALASVKDVPRVQNSCT